MGKNLEADKKKCVELLENNSGGYWWLADDDWFALEEAGWEVEWITQDHAGVIELDEKGRYRLLDALAIRARRFDVSLTHARIEFEELTGQSIDEFGCECCGPPHHMDYN